MTCTISWSKQLFAQAQPLARSPAHSPPPTPYLTTYLSTFRVSTSHLSTASLSCPVRYHDVLAYMADTRKKAHTLLVERLEEVAMPLHGRAIEIVTKQQRWVLFPCAKGTDKVLSDEAAASVSAEWFGVMDEAHSTVKKRRASMASGEVADVVLQQLHVDLWDVDTEWCVCPRHIPQACSLSYLGSYDIQPFLTSTPRRVSYFLVLYKIKGLCFFDKHADKVDAFAGGIEAAVAANHVPISYAIKLEKISHAAHAMGPDYYDGVINVELDNDDQEHIRVGGLNASMHNLLSAINIYKRGAASTDPRKRQSVYMRNEFIEAKKLEDEEAARTRALHKAEEARAGAERTAKQAAAEEAALLAEANRKKGVFGGALNMVNKSRAVVKGEREPPKTKAAKLVAAFEQKSTGNVEAEAGEGAGTTTPASKGKAWVLRKPAWSIAGRPSNLEMAPGMQTGSEKE